MVCGVQRERETGGGKKEAGDKDVREGQGKHKDKDCKNSFVRVEAEKKNQSSNEEDNQLLPK